MGTLLYLAVEFLPVSLSETVVFLPGSVPVLEEGGQLGGGEEGGAAAVGDCCVHVYLICASRCSSGGGGGGTACIFWGVIVYTCTLYLCVAELVLSEHWTSS